MAISRAWVNDTSALLKRGLSDEMTVRILSDAPEAVLRTLFMRWKVSGEFSTWRDRLSAQLSDVEHGHPIHEILKSAGADSDTRALAALDYTHSLISLQGLRHETDTIDCAAKETAWLKATTPLLFGGT